MQKTILILALACLIAPAWASFPYENFVPDNMSYSIENFTHQGKVHQALLVQSQLYAFLMPHNDSTLKPVGEIGLIKSLLHSYHLSTGYSPDTVQNLQKVHAGIDNIRNARKEGEAKCRTLLGTDRLPCESFETCLQACYSVTSFCQPVALGAGRPFINTVWEFENNSRMLDEAYDAEAAAYEEVSKGATYENLKAYLSSIEQINRRATKASSSQLYDSYSYCFSPDYSMPALTNLQLLAQKSYSNFSRFFELDFDSQVILNLTNYGLKKMEYLRASAQASAGGGEQNQSVGGSELAEKYRFLEITRGLFKLGPYNQSWAKKAEPAQPQDEGQHFNIQTLMIASLVSFGAIVVAILVFFKMRDARDRL